MLRFVNSERFLIMTLKLLGNKQSKAIQVRQKYNFFLLQFEVFHLFKLFAANPNKSLKVHSILFKNQERIIKYLDLIEHYKQADSQFLADKVIHFFGTQNTFSRNVVVSLFCIAKILFYFSIFVFS